jgi:hypothetical protein
MSLPLSYTINTKEKESHFRNRSDRSADTSMEDHQEVYCIGSRTEPTAEQQMERIFVMLRTNGFVNSTPNNYLHLQGSHSNDNIVHNVEEMPTRNLYNRHTDSNGMLQQPRMVLTFRHTISTTESKPIFIIQDNATYQSIP